MLLWPSSPRRGGDLLASDTTRTGMRCELPAGRYCANLCLVCGALNALPRSAAKRNLTLSRRSLILRPFMAMLTSPETSSLFHLMLSQKTGAGTGLPGLPIGTALASRGGEARPKTCTSMWGSMGSILNPINSNVPFISGHTTICVTSHPPSLQAMLSSGRRFFLLCGNFHCLGKSSPHLTNGPGLMMLKHAETFAMAFCWFCMAVLAHGCIVATLANHLTLYTIHSLFWIVKSSHYNTILFRNVEWVT